MGKFPILLALGSVIWACGGSLYAQEKKFCGTTEAVEQALKDHPELMESRHQVEESRQAFMTNHSGSTEAAVIYTIPVVFHIIHKYGPENITDAQVQDAIAILNRDFRKKNADTSAIATQHFKDIASDCEIEFKLAKKDPSGNCTNGIDRIVSNETYIGDDGSKLNYWTGSKYLNIWVVNNISSGAAGYSYLPGSAPAGTDGIIILYDYVGSIGSGAASRSRSLGHEVGHYLDLLHTWGWTNSPGVTCGDDFIGDTPITKGWSSCTLINTDVCSSGTPENVQNYMEYSYCSNMFTDDQRDAMKFILSPAQYRNSLVTPTNAAFTGIDGNGPALCTPVADFSSLNRLACVNDPVTFTDLSWRGAPSSWAWSFQGGAPSTSTASSPVVTYAAPGIYSVTMVATNGVGSDSEIKTGYITIFSSVASYTTAPYLEGFEGSTIPTDWTVFNESGVTWAQTSSAKYAGTKCIMINNMSNTSGAVDEIISPSYDLTKMPGPIITFKLAYAQKSSSTDDVLEVFASDDCGKTWDSRFSKTGSLLATIVGPQNTAFYPGSTTQWRNEYINVSPFINSNNVRLKFRFTSDRGNNIFIDNININAYLSVKNEDVGILDLSLFPNPAKQATTVHFIAEKQGEASIVVVDVLGRKVANVFDGKIYSGEQEYKIDTSVLSKGVYYVNVNFDNVIISKPLMIAE